MKTLFAATLLSTLATATAFAQGDDPARNDPGCTTPCRAAPRRLPAPGEAATAEPALPNPTIVAVTPSETPTATTEPNDDNGWHPPAGKRFTNGFRLGWLHIADYDKVVMSRADGSHPDGQSIKSEYGLKAPDMFVIGYEGFYRIIGHSWLNVLMVGNVTVAGLEQSKFIPGASGLLGFEFQRNFQLGVGVNLAPDPQAVSHMIIAAGFTPTVGSIQTPLHVFYMPDPDGNSRFGATVGTNW